MWWRCSVYNLCERATATNGGDHGDDSARLQYSGVCVQIESMIREKQVAYDVFWFMFFLNWGLVPTMGQSTRGPRAREDLLLMERLQGNEGGGITCFPVGDTFVSSETLLKKVPPFISN